MILATNSKLAFCENVQFGFGEREPFTPRVLGAAVNNTKPSAAARDVNAKKRKKKHAHKHTHTEIPLHFNTHPGRWCVPPLFT